VLAATAVLASGSGPSSSVAPSLADCGPRVPAVKCNAILFSPDPAWTLVPPGGPLPTAAPPDAQLCAPDFFDVKQLAKLTFSFGSISCFQFVGSLDWIVLGDGMSRTAEVQEATLGGAIVAVLRCESTDAECLDPNADHSFDGFTVSYPPLPQSGRTQLQWTERRRFLMIYNGGCGLFTFDPDSMHWYQPQSSLRDDILAGEEPTQVKVPPLASGADALQQGAPVGTDDCQALVN
jgi:hypothetical protein